MSPTLSLAPSQLPETWDAEELVFDVASLFGRVTLVVPPSCTVVSEGLLIFGRLADHRAGVESGSKLVVRLRGVSAFTRVDVLPRLTPEAREAAAKFGLAQIGTMTSFTR